MADSQDLVAAGEQFRRRLDAEIWPKGLPWERRIRPGDIDFWRIHAFGLEVLDELLSILLPIGAEGFTTLGSLAWIGSHPDRSTVVAVNLLTGAWDDPVIGAGGPDLISLVAHLAGIGQGQAARWLAEWCGLPAGGRRYA